MAHSKQVYEPARLVGLVVVYSDLRNPLVSVMGTPHI